MVKKLGNYKGNDIELCRTTSSRVGDAAVQALLNNRIPFTRNTKYIPFFKRDKYHGASKIWVITTSPRTYGKARQAIDSMAHRYPEYMVVSNF